jgi:hypothetical protein
VVGVCIDGMLPHRSAPISTVNLHVEVWGRHSVVASEAGDWACFH